MLVCARRSRPSPRATRRTAWWFAPAIPLTTPLDEEGLFVVQDEASQLVALYADAQPGERVLDACASPGGKTTAMAAGMGGTGLVVACDVRGRRIDLLSRTVQRSGAPTIRIVQADATVAPPFAAVFDRVLLDAPCSGLGTVRRDPDIKWRRNSGGPAGAGGGPTGHAPSARVGRHAGRDTRLCDLLERARGERRRRGALSGCSRLNSSPVGRLRCTRHSGLSWAPTGDSGRCRTATAWRHSLPPCW